VVFDWLGTALCYAALAGARPRSEPEETGPKKLPAAPAGRLEVLINGGAVISVTDLSAVSRPLRWTMSLDDKGKLLKVTHSAAPKLRDKVVERKPADVQGTLVRQ